MGSKVRHNYLNFMAIAHHCGGLWSFLWFYIFALGHSGYKTMLAEARDLFFGGFGRYMKTIGNSEIGGAVELRWKLAKESLSGGVF